MDLLQFLGHFHPVLVHLPIGILLTAILFEALSHRKRFRKLRKSVRILLLLGFLSAVFSSITGYILAQSGDYDANLLNLHQWLGISVTVISLVALLLFRRKQKEFQLANGVIVFDNPDHSGRPCRWQSHPWCRFSKATSADRLVWRKIEKQVFDGGFEISIAL